MTYYKLPNEKRSASTRQSKRAARASYDTRPSVTETPQLTEEQVRATEIAFYISAIVFMVIELLMDISGGFTSAF